jgi:hypothetical protein
MSMAQALQIESPVFAEAPMVAPVGATVASEPTTVAAAQPLPAAWYLTPVAVIPLAAAAFIIGNVLMMIPWSAY